MVNKRMVCLLLIVILPCAVFAQTVFDGDGKLIGLQFTSDSSKNKLQFVGIGCFTAKDAELKKAARELILKKLGETLKVLRQPRYNPLLHEFYQLCWNDSAALVEYLTKLQSALLKEDTSGMTDTLSADFKQPIATHLLTRSANRFTQEIDPSNPNELKIWKSDPFVEAIIDYYNATLAQLPSINLETVEERLNYLDAVRTQLDSAILLGRRSTFTKALYQQLTNLHQGLNADSSLFFSIKSDFKQKWFKQWFWFRGGEISLNPFDFTTAAFLRRNPATDFEKARLYNQYIDSMVQRQLRFDSTGRIAEFEHKLRLLHTGEGLFNLKAKNDSIAALNEKIMNNFLQSKQLLNDVKIPLTDSFYNYSSVSDIEYSVNNKTLLNSNIHTDEKKVLVVHNIPGSSIAALVESNKTIPNKSSFQTGADTVVAELGQLAKLVLNVTPLSGILNYFYKTQVVKPANILGNTAASNNLEAAVRRATFVNLGFLAVPYPTPNTPFRSALRSMLIADTLLAEPALFDNLFSAYNYTSAQVAGNATLIEEAATKLAIYFQAVLDRSIRRLQEDSILVRGFIRIYTNSTLAVASPLTPGKNEKPVYYSKVLETATSEEATKKTVKVVVVGKDTTTLGQFTYKVGKSDRFKLSGGVGYTLNSYNQSVAAVSNGQVKITNDVRQYRFILGLNVYFGKRGLYSLDNSFLKWKERNYFFAGVGIPDPLGNLYFGLGHDLLPGLKITGGVHIAKAKKYLIQNNVIVEERLRYDLAGPFVGLSIDADAFINLLNVFKKQ